MTRFVIDSSVVLHLAESGLTVSAGHRLLAPTLLRSQVLSALHSSVMRRELRADVARERLAKVRGLRIRLLGDAVLQRRAWEIADLLGWSSTFDAEYLALTRLQAEAFVTLDPELARQAGKVVTVAPFEALVSPSP